MSDRHLVYVANARLPSTSAHGYQIVQMCDAFAKTGAEVELVVPRRRQPPGEPASMDYYDTPLAFEIHRLPCIDLLWALPRLPDVLAKPIFALQVVSFSIVAFVFVALSGDRSTVYSRSRLFSVLGAPVFRDRLFTEIHRRPSDDLVVRLVGRSLSSSGGVVVISDGLRREWERVVDADVLVEPDAVRLDRFDVPEPSSELRAELNLPTGPLVTYAGSLKSWKGVDTLVEAAAYLPEVKVCVVGGSPGARRRIDQEVGIPENVLFVGHVSPALVPRYLMASDVLVLPNTAEQPISARYTSPLKLFEYMAAGRPIVASDVPSLREVLDDSNAVLFEPDQLEALARAVQTVLEDPGRASERAEQGRADVERWTWSARVRRILAWIGHGR